MMKGQAKVERPPVYVEPIDEGIIPNTGPEKVPGIFEVYDLVVKRNDWSREMFVLAPVDDNGFVRCIALCGCGGDKLIRPAELMHKYHFLYGEP